MTIRHVAARAGVSPATVSRVFSHPDAVTLETRRRVLAAADDLRYAPHPVARSLARGRTGNIGVVVPDIAVAFSSVVVKAVAQRARQDDHALFVADSDDRAADEVRLARAMAQQVDGMLLLSPTMTDDDLRGLAADVPLVLINRQLDGVPAVLMTSATAAAHAVEHLHALGHRELVYLSGPDNWSNAARRKAFEDTCARLGLPGQCSARSSQRSPPACGPPTSCSRARTTGVLAYNDDVAVGVMSRLADRGVAVPGRVSVVGFDDTMLASMVTPHLSTVRLPMAAAGTVAVALLAEVLRGDDVAARGPIELPAELVVRASTGPARAVS